jgi:hypothetical protein
MCRRPIATPFSRGSYSHIPTGARGDDYDALAAPSSVIRSDDVTVGWLSDGKSTF